MIILLATTLVMAAPTPSRHHPNPIQAGEGVQSLSLAVNIALIAS